MDIPSFPHDSTPTKATTLSQTDWVKALLELRGLSLMQAVKEASEIFEAKLDYGNASAWLRHVPGRFGRDKIGLLLNALGLFNQHLDVRQTHWWFLPDEDDALARQQLLRVLEQGAALPSQCLWLSGELGEFYGLAIKAGDASVVLQASNKTNKSHLDAWRTSLPNSCPLLPDAVGRKSKTLWTTLRDAKASHPELLWEEESRHGEDAWQNLIHTCKAKGMTPDDVNRLLDAAQILRRKNESTLEFHARIKAFAQSLRGFVGDEGR